MTRLKQWRWSVVWCLIGMASVELGAQAIHRLTDGTFAQKIYISDAAGNIAGVLNGYLKIVGTVTVDPGASPIVVSVTGVPNVTVDNLAPSATASYASESCYRISTASTNAVNCKASAANYYGLRAVNTTTTIAYLRLYDLASAPTCSSATGYIESIPIPPASAAGGAGGIESMEVIPTNYGTGLGFCITGGGSSTDNTNAGAGIYVKIKYE